MSLELRELHPVSLNISFLRHESRFVVQVLIFQDNHSEVSILPARVAGVFNLFQDGIASER